MPFQTEIALPALAAIDSQQAARILACPSLPTLPAAAVHLLALCREDEVDLSAIADAVSFDPAIAARLLRLANSASAASRGRVATLARAVALLGTSATLGVALTFVLVGGRRRTDRNGFDHSGFWRRALFSAIGGRALGRPAEEAEDVFLACLLQDLGMLALNEVFPSEYGQVCQAAEGDHDVLLGLEGEVLGLDHVGVGGLLARRWFLPTGLQQAVLGSHERSSTSHGDAGLSLQDAVYLSGRLADVWTSVQPAGAPRKALFEAADRLGLQPADIAAVLQRMAAEVPAAAVDFSLDLGGPGRIEEVLGEAQRLIRACRSRIAVPPAEPAEPLPEAPFRAALEDEVERARLTGRPLALLVIRTAAATGTAAVVSEVLRSSLRQTDLLGVVEGLHLALLIDTPGSGAELAAQRVHRRLEERGRPSDVGLVTYPGDGLGSAEHLLAAVLAAIQATPPAGRP